MTGNCLAGQLPRSCCRWSNADMMNDGERVQLAEWVTERLREQYGPIEPHAALHPTDELIATILSQHTADRNSHAAFESLRQRYPTWQEVIEAPREELAGTIRAAGLANIKAARIQQALLTIEERYGTMDLGFVAHLPLDDARRVLSDL